MEQFIIINPNKVLEKEDKEALGEFIEGIFGKIAFDENQGMLIVFYHEIADLDIKEVFMNINADLFLDVNVFHATRPFNAEYVDWACKELKKIPFRSDSFFLDEKELLRRTGSTDVLIKKLIFKELYTDHDMLNTVRVFMECNMNTSKAADVLYMHRNTLINKLDRFVTITSYDIREFRDAFIIYKLVTC